MREGVPPAGSGAACGYTAAARTIAASFQPIYLSPLSLKAIAAISSLHARRIDWPVFWSPLPEVGPGSAARSPCANSFENA